MPTIDEQIAFIEDNAGRWKPLQDLKVEDVEARTVTRTIRGDGTYFTTVRGREQMLLWISEKNTWFYDTEYIDISADLKASLIESFKELQQLRAEWISVEKQPKYAQQVTVAIQNIESGAYTIDQAIYMNGHYRTATKQEEGTKITHYQPLPTPPKQ